MPPPLRAFSQGQSLPADRSAGLQMPLPARKHDWSRQSSPSRIHEADALAAKFSWQATTNNGTSLSASL